VKTWYLPPRFLDDVTLLQEYEDSYDYIHDRIIELQTFLRHKLFHHLVFGTAYLQTID